MQGAAVRRLMHRYDLVVQVLRQSPRRVLVSPPERVLRLQHYENGRSLGSIVFTEKPRVLRRRTLRDVRRSLGRDAAPLQRKSYLSLLRDANFVHELFQLWPRHS